MTGAIDFRAFVNGLPDKYLLCRADGHGPWRALTATWDNDAKVYDRRRRCSGCGTEKPQLLDINGYIVKGGGYKYPPGYLASGVDLPPMGDAKAGYRLALVKRQMAEPRRKR